MQIFQIVRLARKQLFHNKVRLMVAIAGIAFAVLLVFMQTGFRIAIFRSTILYWEKLDADLVITDTLYTNVGNPGAFSRRHLYRCLTVPGVASVNPLYVTRANWKNPETGILAAISVIGIDPANPGFTVPEIRQNSSILKRADCLLFDTFNRPRYGPIVDRFHRDGRVPVILCDQEALVAGLYSVGKPFDVDGSVMVSAEGYKRLFPTVGQGLITLGLLRADPGFPLEGIKTALGRLFGDRLNIYTKAEFIKMERDYTDRTNPIGFVFNLGTIMGLIVGTVIVYQVLFTDVSEHLAEYATLKAMGYSNTFLFSVVGWESLALAVIGFIPGFFVSWGMYRFTATATSLPMYMTGPHVGQVLLFTIGMCGVSGAVALFKIVQADPAEVF